MTKWTVYFVMLPSLVSLSTAASAAVLNAADLEPNDLVITEYLANPVGVSDSLGEYFEIFNTTGAEIDLAGLIVRDDGSNSFTVSAAVIGPGLFAVFSASDGTSLGITPDYIYGSGMSLTNTDDEIGLFRPDDTLIHKITYTDGDFFGAGVAHELAALTGATPSLLVGPGAGFDFIAATASLPLGNLGSPGFAGGTSVNLTAVPVPAAIWMFGSALSMLAWKRRSKPAQKGAHRTGEFDAKKNNLRPSLCDDDLDGHRVACPGGIRC